MLADAPEAPAKPSAFFPSRHSAFNSALHLQFNLHATGGLWLPWVSFTDNGVRGAQGDGG